MNAIYQWLDKPENSLLAVCIVVVLVMFLDALWPVIERRRK